MRAPEQLTWTLMLNPNAAIVAVRQQYAEEKRKLGWLVVARESDLLPFNPPRLIVDTPTKFEEEGA